MRIRSVILGLVAVTCASTMGSAQSNSSHISPQQAVMGAAASPTGLDGTFEMVVRGSGRQGDVLYLNSELDYRDPRNLSIEISDSLSNELAARFGTAPEKFLAGKTIAIKGTALKTRIDFYAYGQRTDKYYYQTHLKLNAVQDLEVMSAMPAG